MEKIIQTGMDADELLSCTKSIPIMEEDRIRFILADEHLVVKTRIVRGREVVAEWNFEKL